MQNQQIVSTVRIYLRIILAPKSLLDLQQKQNLKIDQKNYLSSASLARRLNKNNVAVIFFLFVEKFYRRLNFRQ